MPIDNALLRKPENRALLLCARGREKDDNFASVLGEVSDWEYLVSELHLNRLTLLFLHHIQGHEALVPDKILQDLQITGEKILHWNLFLMAELQGVVQLLTSAGIRVLSYKGPAIAFSAYDTLALRRFVDLDLLISPKDRVKTISTLQAAGYRKFARNSPLTPYIQHQKRKIAYEIPMASQDGFVNLDIHWSVVAPFESFPLGFEHLWAHRVPVGAIPSVYAPRREDLVLSLCFHGLKHHWQELEWISCLLGLLHNKHEEPLDWHRIEFLLRSAGCQRVLYLGLQLADDLATLNGEFSSTLDKVLPLQLRQHIKNDPTVKRMTYRTWAFLLQGKGHCSNSALLNSFRENIVHPSLGIRARTGWRSKWKYLCGSLSTFIVSFEHSRTLLLFLAPLLSKEKFSSQKPYLL
ncbi:hypothetical protein IAD21_05208 [Abditibacteriota bacterium]|nr:hypothetical protein IAD21_05208 [Abditibacteriota bacterium]